MDIIITGASGYIGSKLKQRLTVAGHQVITLTRDYLYGREEDLVNMISGAHAVVNLAGAPILQRWTKYNRINIYNSRILTTKKICKGINSLSQNKRPKAFISASAVGIYKTGMQHDETSSKLATTFPGKLVMDWEDASKILSDDVRRVIFRLGITVGKDSKMIKNLLPSFRLGLGAKVGDGYQAFPFIHIVDVVRAFSDALTNSFYAGVFNLVAPGTVNNREFTNQFANALNRKSFLTIPPFFLKAILGEASELLLSSPKVSPKRLAQMGFPFKYPDISSAINEIIS